MMMTVKCEFGDWVNCDRAACVREQGCIERLASAPFTRPHDLEADDVAFNYVVAMRDAQQIVEYKFLYKKFIDGTPLANDIAVWMADYAKDNFLAARELSRQTEAELRLIAECANKAQREAETHIAKLYADFAVKEAALRERVAELSHHLAELGKVADSAAMIIATIVSENDDEEERLQAIMDGISRWARGALLNKSEG